MSTLSAQPEGLYFRMPNREEAEHPTTGCTCLFGDLFWNCGCLDHWQPRAKRGVPLFLLQAILSSAQRLSSLQEREPAKAETLAVPTTIVEGTERFHRN